MTLAPVRASPLIGTPAPIEALIKEARQKTRRRRMRYTILALMILAVVAALVASNSFGRTGPRIVNVKTVSAATPDLPRCNSSHLRVSSVGAPGGSMHDGVIVRLRNAGTDSCSLSGYPSVWGINHWNGRVLKGSTTRNSYLGGWDSSKPLPTVALRGKSGIASFLVTGVDAAIDNPSCPNLTILRVTIPPSGTVFRLPTSFNACKGGFQVHPFVRGATGTSP